MSHQYEILDIPLLIKENKLILESSVIKQMEDMLSELFFTNKYSSLTENPFIFLWNLQDVADFINISNVEMPQINNFIEVFDIPLNELKNVVICGPPIRKIFDKSDTTTPCIQELFVFRYGKEDESPLSDELDLSSFTELYSLYTKKVASLTLSIIKKIYKSPASVILTDKYFKRIGLVNNKIYISSMFIVEYFKNFVQEDNTQLRDPVFNVPMDLFEIYEGQETRVKTIFDMIDMKDTSAIMKFKNFSHNKLKNNMNCIEYAISLYVKEECDIIKNQIRHGILFLNCLEYVRKPYLYAKMCKLNEIDNELYEIISSSSDVILDFIPQSIDSINEKMCEYYVMSDKPKLLFEYLKETKTPINNKIIEDIINFKPLKVIKYGIQKNYFKDFLTHKIILCTQELDYFDDLLIPYDEEIAFILLEEILQSSFMRTFYYIYKNNPNVLYKKFSHDNNILHILKPSGSYVDLIELIMKLDEDKRLLNEQNEYGETPIVYHAKLHHQVVFQLLKYLPNENLVDNMSNNLLHNLAILGDANIFKVCAQTYKNLINIQNKDLNTPALLAVNNLNESIYYILQGLKADMKITDKYGNTPYHYICKNEICVGTAIEQIKNNFGFTPKDYCKISPTYYYFI